MAQRAVPTGLASFLKMTFNSLRYRDFRLVWLGSATEHIGEFMELTAMSWLMWELTESEFFLGLLFFARVIPLAIFPLLGGVMADRVNRKGLLIATLLFAGLLSASLLALVLTGIIPQTETSQSETIAVSSILAVAALGGVAMSFNHPARASIVPNLVPRDQLMNAISLDTFSVFGSVILGPLLAGQMMALWGVAPVLAIRVGGVLLAVGWLLPTRIPATPAQGLGRAVWGNLREGMHYLRGSRRELSLVALFFIPSIFGQSYITLLPTFADEVLGAGERGLGYLQGASGVGALLAVLALASLGGFRQKGSLLLGTGMALGLAILGFSASRWLGPSLFLLIVVGGMNAAFTTTNVTLTQALIPDEMRGRIMSLREVARGIGMSASSLSIGALGSGLGAPQAVAVFGALCFVISLALYAFLTPVRRIREA